MSERLGDGGGGCVGAIAGDAAGWALDVGGEDCEMVAEEEAASWEADVS